MDLDEQIFLQMARERILEAVCSAERRRQLRSARPRQSARDRLGSALVQVGRWVMGQP
jgi:hypothetical protein